MKKIGIVGWGYWGRNYAKYFDTYLGATLTHVCDLRGDMLEDAKMLYPHFITTPRLEDLIEAKLDGVIIASPASAHFKIAQKFLEAGIPLLIEKPLTNSLTSANELDKIAKKNSTKVLIGHTFLYNQSVRFLKSEIDANRFGKLYYLEFRRQSYGPIRDDVNIIWDFAPHDVAIANYLLGGISPVSVSVQGGIFSRHDKEDIAVITLKYPGNIMVNINVAWLYPLKIRSLTLLGDKQMAVFEDTNQVSPVSIYDTSLLYPKEEDPSGASIRLGEVRIPRIPAKDPLGTQLRHFIAYLNDEEKPFTPIADGVTVVSILEAMQESLRTGKSVDMRDGQMIAQK